MNERHIYKHVAVIGLDGMGVFNRLANTPCMDKIFANGAETYSARSLSPTSSAENWGAMLLGASPEIHAMANLMDRDLRNPGDRFPSVFKRLREVMPDARLSSFVNWRPINNELIEEGLNIVTASAKDEELCTLIVEEVANKPVFLFVQFDEIDGAGHGDEYGSEPYLKQIEIEDGYVGRIYEAYEKAGIIDDTLFICVADHGGIITGHGSYSDQEKYIYLAAAGKNVPHGEIGEAYTRDISAIILYAFGVDYPEYDEYGFSSQVPGGIFPEKGSDYKKVEEIELSFEKRETPDAHGEGGLFSCIPEDRVRLALFMDGEICDMTGKNELVEIGKVAYEDGVYGKCGVIGKNGHIHVKDFALGSGSYTAAYWGKIRNVAEESFPVFANKDWHWRVRKGNGVGLAFRMHDIIFDISDGKNAQEITVGFPLAVNEGWLHVMVSVDKENKKVGIFMNFKKVYEADLFDNLVDAGDTGLPFNIGDDAIGDFTNGRYELEMRMDDFLLIDGAFSEEDAAKLAQYYGM